MIIRELHRFQSELATLDSLMNQLPASNVIERMSLEARKNEVSAALSAYQQTSYYEPVCARLTFRGKPIVKSHGIFTEFAADVLDKFEDMVAAIGASQNYQLGARGAIPNREDYRLIITGTTPGSFGFELEEAPNDKKTLFPELSPVKAAIEQAKSIMESSVGSDDDLTEAIADANPRAIEAMRTFLETMVDHEAVCALELEGKPFGFADVGQVRRTRERLSQENIHEEDKDIFGTFQGVLPTRRTFEFLIKESGVVIVGKVGPEIEEPSKINHVVEKSMKIRVHTKQVGTGQPRYVLLGYEEMTEQSED